MLLTLSREEIIMKSKASVPTRLLEGIRVIDLTRVLAGPYATMVLRHLGARVTKIERPCHGDDSRAFGPFLQGKSTYFTALNCGKESIALDLKSPADREIFESLLETADVVVENFRPGVMDALGYDWDSLHHRFPRLIFASASGFGQTGPYRHLAAYDIVAEAMSGLMSITGEAGGQPVRCGVSIGDITAGLYLAIGICAALLDRAQHGHGRRIDVAMLDCQVAILENALTSFAATSELPQPEGTRHPSLAPFGAFRAADGALVIAVGNDALFVKLCQALGCAELATDPRFASNEERHRHVDALTDILERYLAQGGVDTWIDTLRDAGVPCGPINDIAAVMRDPQLAARRMIVSVQDPAAGLFRIPGNPLKVDGEDGDASAFDPAPELDADRARILAELNTPRAVQGGSCHG